MCKELRKYEALTGAERQFFATGIIEGKIAKGKGSPNWVHFLAGSQTT